MHRHDDVTAAAVRMLRQSRYTCMAAVVRILRRPPHNRQKAEKGAEVHNGHFSESLCIVAVYHLYRTEARSGHFSESPLSVRDFCINIHSHPCRTAPFPIKQKLPKALCGFREQAYAGSKRASVMTSLSDMVLFFLPLQHHLLCVMVSFSFRYGIIFLTSRHYFTNAAMGFRSPSTFVIKALAEPNRR